MNHSSQGGNALLGGAGQGVGGAGKIFHGRQGEAFEGDGFLGNLSFVLLDWILKGPFFDRDVFFLVQPRKQTKKQGGENELFCGGPHKPDL